jgi:hypothetical protein
MRASQREKPHSKGHSLTHSGKYLLRQGALPERETFYFFLLFSMERCVCAYSYITARPITSILQAVKKFSNKALRAAINGPRRDSTAPVTIDFFHLAARFVGRLAPVWPIFPPDMCQQKRLFALPSREENTPSRIPKRARPNISGIISHCCSCPLELFILGCFHLDII